MMTVDPQRHQALAEKITKVVQNSKKFAKVIYATHDVHITVEVELHHPSEQEYNSIREAVTFAYNRWGTDPGRVENLYATLALIWPDSMVVISELDNVGSGTTTYFNQSPSQAKLR